MECATEGHAEFEDRWTNMGHTWTVAVDTCRVACTFAGRAPKVVVSIREPYHYWRSVFTYAWMGAYTAAKIPRGVVNFSGFMRHSRDTPSGREYAQTTLIQRACGMPCVHDYILHTERLSSDWLHLLRSLRLPLVGLRRMNPTLKEDPNNGPPPPTLFSKEVVQIIDKIDANMFNEFGYAHRIDVPFRID